MHLPIAYPFDRIKLARRPLLAYSWRMGLFSRLLCVLMLLLAQAVWAAEPTVGKLDGVAGPSLAPLSSPSLAKEEKLPDSGLPVFFEKNGDWRGAAGAWQELAYASMGDVRRHALVMAALDLAKASDNVTAGRLGLILLNGDEPNTSDNATRAQVFNLLLPLAQTSSTLATQFTVNLAARKPTPLRDAALYRLIWQATVTASPSTPLPASYSLPLAQKLIAQTADLDHHLHTRVQRAELFGALLPGLGHAWLGLPGTAAAVLPLWAFMLWLALWSYQHRQWPLLVVGVAGAVALWAASPLLAANTAAVQNQQLRGYAIAEWLSLQPAPLPLVFTPPGKSKIALPAIPAAAAEGDLAPLPGLHTSATTSLSPTEQK